MPLFRPPSVLDVLSLPRLSHEAVFLRVFRDGGSCPCLVARHFLLCASCCHCYVCLEMEIYIQASRNQTPCMPWSCASWGGRGVSYGLSQFSPDPALSLPECTCRLRAGSLLPHVVWVLGNGAEQRWSVQAFASAPVLPVLRGGDARAVRASRGQRCLACALRMLLCALLWFVSRQPAGGPMVCDQNHRQPIGVIDFGDLITGASAVCIVSGSVIRGIIDDGISPDPSCACGLSLGWGSGLGVRGDRRGCQ